VQELGSMTVSKEMAASKTTAELTATVNPDRDGYYYFELLVVDAEGKEQLRNGVYQVATPRTTEGDVDANPGTANPGIANPGIANPGIANPGIANPGSPLADEATVGAEQPVAAPEARPTQEQAPVRAPAANRTPAANGSASGSTAAAPSAPQPTAATPATTTAATPISPLPAPLRVAPAGVDLWSGLGASRPSLLDTPAPAPADGLPIGAGLLGVGTVALAGMGAFAGRRRFALVRRVRS